MCQRRVSTVLPAIAGFLFLAISACDRGPENRRPAPVLIDAPITDAFAGQTVTDIGKAQGIVMTRMGNPPVSGQQAPETEFIEAESGKSMLLSEMIREKPAVLIFGSGSCSALNVSDYQIERLAKRYSEDAGFFFVYIREAHPAGGFNPQLMGSSAEVEIPEIADAESLEVRRETASAFAQRAGFSFSILADKLNDAAAVRWGGWPLRIFVIDRDGSVIYAGDQGPWHFKPVESYQHAAPTAELDAEFRKRAFDRSSLGKFLEEHVKGSHRVGFAP